MFIKLLKFHFVFFTFLYRYARVFSLLIFIWIPISSALSIYYMQYILILEILLTNYLQQRYLNFAKTSLIRILSTDSIMTYSKICYEYILYIICIFPLPSIFILWDSSFHTRSWYILVVSIYIFSKISKNLSCWTISEKFLKVYEMIYFSVSHDRARVICKIWFSTYDFQISYESPVLNGV